MSTMLKYYAAFSLIILGVAALVVYGFTVIGTPSQRMAAQYDSARMSHFSSISYQINYYYENHGQLPASLTDVTAISSYNKDPQTNAAYTYNAVKDTSYQLCANFSEDSAKEKANANDYYYDSSTAKTHKKGYDCLTYDIPSTYIKKPILQDKTVPQYSLPIIAFKDVAALVKTKNPDATAFSTPVANATFWQGNPNVIQSKYTLTVINLYLIDSSNNLIGGITPSGSCTNKSNPCTIYWDAQLVRDASNNLVSVKPGTYKIAMISAYNDPLALGGISNQFTIK